MSKLVFIRHAQASYMADDYDQLSELGVLQSESLGNYFRKERIVFDRVFLGPLKRHRQTFEHCFKIASDSLVSEPKFLDGLKEHNGPEALKVKYNSLEHDYDEVKEWKRQIELNPENRKRLSLRIFRLFMKEWMAGNIVVDHPSVLNFDHWLSDVKNALSQILGEVQSNENIGIITSGGTKGAIIAHALGIKDGAQIANFNDSIRNTSMSYFNYSRLGFNVLSFNEIPHLTKEQITFV